jgi:PKD repeat protein
MTGTRRLPAVALTALAVVLALLVPIGPSRAATTGVVVASDNFNRSVATGWGTAPVGGTWVLDTDARANVNGSDGALLVPDGRTRMASLPTVVAEGQVTQAVFTFPALPTQGSLHAGVTLQRQGDSYGWASVRVSDRGTVFLSISAIADPFFNNRLTLEQPVGRIEAGGSVAVKAQATGGNTGVIQAKAWDASLTEPNSWQVGGASSAIPATGTSGVRMLNEGTGALLAVLVGDFTVTSTASSGQEPNQAPVPSFTTSLEGGKLTVDATASFDPDGQIVAYAWDFGDDSAATEAVATHQYQAPGTFTVTLTVVDNQGLRASTSQEVTLAVSVVKPDASNTGVPDSVTLKTLTASNKPYSGDSFNGDGSQYTINTVGAEYVGWRFNAFVQVRAQGVTFRDCYFAGSTKAPTSSTALLLIRDDRNGPQVPSAQVLDSTFKAQAPTPQIDGVRGSNVLLRRVEISNVVDGMHIYGSTAFEDEFAGNVVVLQSWIHDLTRYPNDGSHPDGSHNDAIQIIGGRNIIIAATRIDGEIYNAGVMVTQQRNAVANITMVNNWLAGGSCTVNVYDGSGANRAITGLAFARNIFTRGSTTNPDCAVIISERSQDGLVFVDNVWADAAQPPPSVKRGGRSTALEYEWSDIFERFVLKSTLEAPAPGNNGNGNGNGRAKDNGENTTQSEPAAPQGVTDSEPSATGEATAPAAPATPEPTEQSPSATPQDSAPSGSPTPQEATTSPEPTG